MFWLSRFGREICGLREMLQFAQKFNDLIGIFNLIRLGPEIRSKIIGSYMLLFRAVLSFPISRPHFINNSSRKQFQISLGQGLCQF